MANYKRVGLSATEISELKKDWKERSWRLKFLKPAAGGALKMPDVTTTNLYKYDATDMPLGNWIKCIHDPKINRTFFLHYMNIWHPTYAIVSIINHYLGADDPDYIEKINITTSAGWPVTYNAGMANDMAYDPASQQLAIAVMGAGSPDVGPPALFMINCQKYVSSLKANYCATLDDNPDYLACTVWAGGTTVVGVYPGYIRFVRFYDGRWWTWTDVKGVWGGGNDYLWQLGFFISSVSYTVVAQYGYAPPWNGLNGKGETWAASVVFPGKSRWFPMSSSLIGFPDDGIDGYYCDPAAAFANVTSFEVVPGGELGKILIGTTPSGAGLAINEFGIEGFLFKIDIATLLANYAAPAPVASGSWVKPAVYNPDTGWYNVLASVETATLDTTSIRGYCRVLVTEAHIGTLPDFAAGDRFRVQSRFGTVNIGFGSVGPGTWARAWHVSTFCDAESIKIGLVQYGDGRTFPFSLVWNYCAYPLIPGLEECIGIHSADPIVQVTDTDRPMTAVWTPPECGAGWEHACPPPASYSWNLARYLYSGGKWTRIREGIVYNAAANKYVFPVLNETSGGLGLWTHDGTALTRLTAAETALDYDFIGAMAQIDDAGEYALLASNDAGEDNLSIQFFRTADNSFLPDKFTAELIRTDSAATGVWWNPDSNAVGFCTGTPTIGGSGEIWFWYPETTDGWLIRDPRMWWDGENPDAIIGGDGTHVADDMGQPATFFDPSFSESKGQSSNEFGFGVRGTEYLPNVESPLNENADFPGTYDGLLQDGSRFIVESGVLLSNGTRTWHPEGLFYVLRAPDSASEAIGDTNATGLGIISLAVTHAIYRGVHEPDINEYSAVVLITVDNLIFHYEVGGDDVTDWLSHPEPIIYADGVITAGYQIDLAAGTVTFGSSQSGKTITATFSAYEAGTNEAEDIIICILTFPQELNGAGLDESFITDTIIDEELSTLDHLTYSFSKNNIYNGASENKIYVDGVQKTAGIDFTWNYRDGSVTFGVSQIGHLVTGDCKFFTIQKSGVTIDRIWLTPKSQSDAHVCIQEICRRVAPNYVLFERRDGKVACEFVTQAASGDEDIEITDSDIIITDIGAEPAYENLATSVISYGQAEIDQLPNQCLGKTVTDHWAIEAAARGWPRGWHAGTNVQVITDGDPKTQATTGYGRWSEGTYQVQADLIAAGDAGIPCLSVDMGSSLEIETVILARGSQVSTEGDAGATCAFSLWISGDGATWEKIISTFALGPGQNVQFEAGTAFDDGMSFQYIQVRVHSLGLYVWGKGGGHTDSQLGISEIQAYTSKQIEGIATLQSDDPAADYYDEWGLLDRYGIRTVLARNGQPDPALDSQAKADADAGFCLMEYVRLLSRITLNFPWLPAVPKYSTIKIINALTQTSASFFVESRTGSDDGHSLTGTTLP